METTIKLTEAEKEMIRLKREEEKIQKEKDALKEQLEYDKLLHKQDENIDGQVLNQRKQNILIEKAFNVLKESGLDENVVWLSKGTIKFQHKWSWERDKIKKEDLKQQEVEKLKINTKYGSIDEIHPGLKAYSPMYLKAQYRAIKISTIANKIKEQIEIDKNKIKSLNKLNKTKEELIREFQDNSPKGTTIEYKKDTKHNYGRNYSSWDIHTLNILYPNKSWVKIRFYNDKSWSIMEKFDSKYIKPETKEEWLEYLQK